MDWKKAQAELADIFGEQTPLLKAPQCFWALEEVASVLRRLPKWQHHGKWLESVVINTLESALQSMGWDYQLKNGILKISDTGYEQNLQYCFDKLWQPHTSLPLPNSRAYTALPLFELSGLPWLTYLTLKQNHPWATAVAHESKRSEINQRLETLFLETDLDSLDLTVSSQKKLARRMLKVSLTPFLFDQSPCQIEQNLDALFEIFSNEKTPDDFISILLKLLHGPSLWLSVVATGACLKINIAPTSPKDAKVHQRNLAFFNPLPASLSEESQERVIEVIQMLATETSDFLEGRDNPDFLNSVNLVNQSRLPEALNLLEKLVKQKPECALFVRSRGRVQEKLGEDQYALDDYQTAIRLKSDYWQAYMNRGQFYVRKKKFKQAFADFSSALKIRPHHKNTRKHLIIAYYLMKNPKAS